MVYEDAPRRAEIESMIEAAMEGHIQLTGSTRREREQILEVSELVRVENSVLSIYFFIMIILYTHSWEQESKRISELLRRRQEEPEAAGSKSQYIPPPWPGMEDPFLGR